MSFYSCSDKTTSLSDLNMVAGNYILCSFNEGVKEFGKYGRPLPFKSGEEKVFRVFQVKTMLKDPSTIFALSLYPLNSHISETFLVDPKSVRTCKVIANDNAEYTQMVKEALGLQAHLPQLGVASDIINICSAYSAGE